MQLDIRIFSIETSVQLQYWHQIPYREILITNTTRGKRNKANWLTIRSDNRQSVRPCEAMKLAGDSGCVTIGIHYSYRLAKKSGSFHVFFYVVLDKSKVITHGRTALSSLLLSLSILGTLSVVTEILNEKLHANVT